MQKIIQRTLDQVHGAKPDSPRNIVLLHDAGGDRSQTVAALPTIIDELKKPRAISSSRCPISPA